MGMQRELGWVLGPFWCSHLALCCPGGGPVGLGEAAAFAPKGVTGPLLLQRLKSENVTCGKHGGVREACQCCSYVPGCDDGCR